MLVDHILNIKDELKNLKKQETQAIFTKMNSIRLVFKESKRRTASDKILRDKALNIAKNPKYDAYPRGLVAMDFLIKSLLHLQINLYQAVVLIYH